MYRRSNGIDFDRAGEDASCHWADYAEPSSLPDRGVLAVGGVSNKTDLSGKIAFPDSCAWQVPELGVSVEPFAHRGFIGTVREFLLRARHEASTSKEADNASHSESNAADKKARKIATAVKQLDALVIGDVNASALEGFVSLGFVLRDPTGLLRVENPTSLNLQKSLYTRSEEENGLLGIRPGDNEGMGGEAGRVQSEAYMFSRFATTTDVPHFEYSCDNCSCPIAMNRYHCTECPDYDLCVRCARDRNGCPQCGSRLSHETMPFTDMKRKIMSVAGGLGYQAKLSCELFYQRPCLGSRQLSKFEPRPDPIPLGNDYDYMTYGEVLDYAMAIAKGTHELLLSDCPLPLTHENHNGDPVQVAIYMKNSLEWAVIDYAMALLGLTIVPVDPGAPTETVEHILKVTDCHLIFCGVEQLTTLSKVAPPHMRHVVWFDNFTNIEVPPVMPSTLFNHNLLDVLAAGKKSNLTSTAVMPMRREDQVFTLIFTSGSTGRPKGAIQTHGIWMQCGFDRFLRTDPLVSVAFRPFSYATDREMLWRNFGNGGRIAIFNGEVVDLIDELVKIQPSAFSSPPRIWNALFGRFKVDYAAEMTKHEARLLEAQAEDALDPPQDKAPTREERLRERVRRTVLRTYSKKVGTRCGMVGVGSAPVRPEVFRFLKECFSEEGRKSVYESYGTTENGGITLNGYVYSDTRVLLIDVPEMGFLTTSVPKQGEICVITSEQIPGYWRDAENTNKLFHIDDNGEKWVKTGDIGELRDGKLLIIDRRANLTKLANGVFVSPEHLEGVFLNCPSVKDCFVHAEAHWEFPMAVVSLNDAALAENAQNEGEPIDWPTRILTEMRTAGAQRQVAQNNLPHCVLVSNERFSVENGCLTISYKLSRPGLRRAFKEKLEVLYESLVGGDEPGAGMGTPATTFELTRESTAVLFEGGAAEAQRERILSKLYKAYKKVLHLQNVRSEHTAKDLGADSLGIAMLRDTIAASCFVRVSLQTLWEASVEAVATLIVQQRQRNGTEHTGKVPVSKSAGTELDATTQEAMKKSMDAATTFDPQSVIGKEGSLGDIPQTSDQDAAVEKLCAAMPKRVVFLTGATGLIGNEIARQLIEQEESTVVVALVRGADRLSAEERLVKTCAVDPESKAAAAVANGRLLVVTGDISAPFLGLASLNVIRGLRTVVTDVIHCGANVNHLLPYTALASANVDSLRFVLTIFGSAASSTQPSRCAALAFVSTVSVTPLTTSHSESKESMAIDNLPAAALNGSLGYALSKWAAERLLLDAAAKGAVNLAGSGEAGTAPLAAILRCGMTSWHRRIGYGNPSDWIGRLALAARLAGCYPSAADKTLQQPRFCNFVPVDTMATMCRTVTASLTTRPAAATPVVHLLHGSAFDLNTVFTGLELKPVTAKVWESTLRTLSGDSNDDADAQDESLAGSEPPKPSRELSNADRSLLRSVLVMFGSSVPGGQSDVHPPHTVRLLREAAPDVEAARCKEIDEVSTAAYCKWILSL